MNTGVIHHVKEGFFIDIEGHVISNSSIQKLIKEYNSQPYLERYSDSTLENGIEGIKESDTVTYNCCIKNKKPLLNFLIDSIEFEIIGYDIINSYNIDYIVYTIQYQMEYKANNIYPRLEHSATHRLLFNEYFGLIGKGYGGGIEDFIEPIFMKVINNSCLNKYENFILKGISNQAISPFIIR